MGKIKHVFKQIFIQQGEKLLKTSGLCLQEIPGGLIARGEWIQKFLTFSIYLFRSISP